MKRIKTQSSRRPSSDSDDTLRQLCTPSATEFSCSGILETHPKGYGFLRPPIRGYSRSNDDTFVSQTIITHHKLQQGCRVSGVCRRGRLCEITQIDGIHPDSYETNRPFHERTPTSPNRWLQLGQRDGPTSMRILDLLTPIGFGQRVLIAAPPRAGKTTLLQQIGKGVAENYPETERLVLLVDERPEEITEMRDSLPAEIYSSSLDSTIENQTRISRLIIDRCQRLVEQGRDVVLLVDSLTRLTRAFNKLPGGSSMMGSGGLRVDALEVPRKLFSAARAFKDAPGSLTIVATVLIGTQNRMDDVIYREFKGTGNTDIVLDQDLADESVWPALNIRQSATRRVERLQDPERQRAISALRRSLIRMPESDAMRDLIAKLEQFRSDAAFVNLINQSMASEPIRP